MNRNSFALSLAALTLGLTLAASPSQAGLLVQQAPLTAANQVVVASDGQALLPAEDFSFNGTANTLSWWGTYGIDFFISLYAQTDTAAPLQEFMPSFAGLAPVATMEVDGQTRDIYRYSLDLGALPAGSYTVSIGELSVDALLGETWYWLRGAGGDGLSRYGLGDPGGGRFGFDLSLQVDGDQAVKVPLPGTLPLLLLGSLLAWRLGRSTPSSTVDGWQRWRVAFAALRVWRHPGASIQAAGHAGIGGQP